MRRSHAVVLLLATFLAERHAAAARPALAPVVAAEQAPASPPSVKLTIDAPTPTGRWTMRVENTGAVPLRLAADVLALSLEVTAPGAKRAARCALPNDMRPPSDEEHALVLAAKQVYAESFEARLYCFDATAAGALVPGATVVAHLGWPPATHASRRPPAPPRPPFVISPVDGTEPHVDAAKEIVSEPMTLATPNSTSTSTSTSTRPRPRPRSRSRLRLRLRAFLPPPFPSIFRHDSTSNAPSSWRSPSPSSTKTGRAPSHSSFAPRRSAST